MGTGGVTGTGLMEGKQKLFYLPEPHTDFIFAVTAEELGLVGAMFVVALFAIFLWRGMRASWRTEDIFGRYLAVGITSMVVLQAFINISVVLGHDADEGHSAAAGVVRRIVIVRDPGVRRRAVEYHQAGGVSDAEGFPPVCTNGTGLCTHHHRGALLCLHCLLKCRIVEPSLSPEA